jgi:hypothetical protein
VAFPLSQIATSDLDLAVRGQLATANLPLGDEFEPSPVKVVGIEAAFRRWGLREKDLENAPGNPRILLTPMPNSTTERWGFHRASGGKRKNMCSWMFC